MKEHPVPPRRDLLAIGFGILVAVVFAAALMTAWPMPRSARLMPIAICILGLALCAIGGLRALGRTTAPGREADGGVGDMGEGTDVEPLAALRYGAWMTAYVVGLWLFGLVIATAAFTAAFLRVERKSPILAILTVVGITLACAFVLGKLLSIRWPSGLITSWF